MSQPTAHEVPQRLKKGQAGAPDPHCFCATIFELPEPLQTQLASTGLLLASGLAFALSHMRPALSCFTQVFAAQPLEMLSTILQTLHLSSRQIVHKRCMTLMT